MKKIWLVVTGFMILLGTSCKKAGKSGELDEDKLLMLVNERRASGCDCGGVYYPSVAEIKWNNDLEKAAKKHSKDMYKRSYFNHVDKNGNSAGDRIKKEGYDWSVYGENIAMGYYTEEDVVNGWLNSPGHCTNIMNTSYTEMGVGMKEGYWSQVFARPK